MYESRMKKLDRNARIKKHNSEDKIKNTNEMKNCSTPPPLPPYGDEEGWELQFCKWWGWNWVRKEKRYVNKIDHEFQYDGRSLKEQTMKNMQKMRGAGKQTHNDVLVTRTDSFQQTQEMKKTKKKKYYHLVCSGCYPQICCCRCHKQTHNKEVQHCGLPLQSNAKDSSREPKYSIYKPNDDKHKIPELPPGDYTYQQLRQDSSKIRRHLPNRPRYRPLKYHVQLHRCNENKEETNYVETKGERHFCCHCSHLGDEYDQIIPEKENPDRLNNKQINESPKKSVNFKRRQSALPVLSESSYSDNVSEIPSYSVNRNCFERCAYKNKEDSNVGIKDQLCQERWEATYDRPEQKNIRSTQESHRRMRCQSYPGSPKDKDSPNCYNWYSPLHASKPSKYRRKLFDRYKFVRKYHNFQKQQPHKSTKTTNPKRPSSHINNYPHVPCKKPKISDTQETEFPYKIYRDWNIFGKNMLPKFGSYNRMYHQIKNTRSDIFDRHYSLKLEEEFPSPVLGKMYNLSPRSILDPKNYTRSSLPDPIDVDNDFKYLENVKASVKVDHNTRIMLDAACDAILFNNKHQTAESTLIRKFSYPDVDEDVCNKFDGSSRQLFPISSTPQKSDLVFMEKLEKLVESILNSKLEQCKKRNDENNDSPVLSVPNKLPEITTDSQLSTGHSISEQFNKLNNLFEKMDQVTTQNEANIKKIQDAIQPLSETKEKNSNLEESTNQPLSVSLIDKIMSSFNKKEEKHSTMPEDLRSLPKINDKTKTLSSKNEVFPESSTSGINRTKNFNIQSSHSYGNQQEASKFVFKNVSDVSVKSKLPVFQHILNNTYPVSISRTRKGFRTRDTIKNRKMRTRIPVRKKI
ncbi:uncharacterized protein LOC130902133 isoform X2 [Diorhabda carinulata]|uniref:uncharacterized protein LOC130902133 isoform X2 n=1 Tax=Diorhabda carinulata TaxID=1163345 RepID=UPI0025A2F2B1|nr:uncharacterized protein LOC130902133 isoform X2 [Diorhabda carinulata]